MFLPYFLLSPRGRRRKLLNSFIIISSAPHGERFQQSPNFCILYVYHHHDEGRRLGSLQISCFLEGYLLIEWTGKLGSCSCKNHVQNMAYIRGIVQAGILCTCRNCEVGEGDQGEDEKTGRSSCCNGNRAPSLWGAQVHSWFLNKQFVCFAALCSKHYYCVCGFQCKLTTKFESIAYKTHLQSPVFQEYVKYNTKNAICKAHFRGFFTVMMLVFLCRREASTKGWWSATMPVYLWVPNYPFTAYILRSAFASKTHELTDPLCQ